MHWKIDSHEVPKERFKIALLLYSHSYFCLFIALAFSIKALISGVLLVNDNCFKLRWLFTLFCNLHGPKLPKTAIIIATARFSKSFFSKTTTFTSCTKVSEDWFTKQKIIQFDLCIVGSVVRKSQMCYWIWFISNSIFVVLHDCCLTLLPSKSPSASLYSCKTVIFYIIQSFPAQCFLV